MGDFRDAFSGGWKMALGLTAAVVFLLTVVLLATVVQGTPSQIGFMALMALVIVAVVAGLARIHTTNRFVCAAYGLVGLGVAGGVATVVWIEAGFIGFRSIPKGPRLVPGYVAGVAQANTSGGDSLSYSAPLDFNDLAYRARVLNWVRNHIGFDTVTHGQSDRNYMDRNGTRGQIVAADRIHTTSHSKLRSGHGRFLWRVRLGAAGYRHAGLPGGTSYVFVDNFVRVKKRQNLNPDTVRLYVEYAIVHDHPDSLPRNAADSLRWLAALDTVRQAVVARYLGQSGPAVSDSTLAVARTSRAVLEDADKTQIIGFARGIVIPEGSDSVKVIHITIKRHYEYWWNRPIARWLGPGTYHPWSNCDTHGCCEGWCSSAC